VEAHIDALRAFRDADSRSRLLPRIGDAVLDFVPARV
jgi:hypothetical protein